MLACQLASYFDVDALGFQFRCCVLGKRFESVHDGAVAGAAADVPLQGSLHILHSQLRPLLLQQTTRKLLNAAYTGCKRCKCYRYLYIDMTIPGLQNPHWLPFKSANCDWTGWYPSFLPPIPSMVISSLPWQANKGSRHCFINHKLLQPSAFSNTGRWFQHYRVDGSVVLIATGRVGGNHSNNTWSAA